MRNLVARARRRPAQAPPSLPAADAERFGRLPSDPTFVTGNGFAAGCRHVINYAGLTVDEEADNDWYFCKVDYLDWFFERVAPRRPYVLVSHNGDLPVDERFRRRLRGRSLKAWFAANVELRHPKLVPIPLGIANPGWEHGDPGALRAAQARGTDKTELFDVSFSVETNPAERRRCLEATGLSLAPRVPHREYLERLASARFCISPSGNGLDTHRTWEALYLRTVPVVTRSPLSDEYHDLPLMVLESWPEFGSIDFSPALYDRLMAAWHPASLSMAAIVERLRRRVASAA